MKKSVWIVVANRAVARLFRTSQPTGPLEEMDSFIHPEGRMLVQELVSDRAGRGFERFGPGGHAEDPDTTATAHEMTSFATALSRCLRKARTDGEFHALALIAAPAFLGAMREQLDAGTRERVMLEVNKNLVHLDAVALRAQLPERLFSTIDA
ncbi:host attachment protein [Dyella halodurans]|uniref:Host attachment protein n=1 Tax=Dyella halodurans TaxID=1920171 RepID=A0ABV9BXV5_9GAMM|nr:host attachment protein [Dyella halodurans]